MDPKPKNDSKFKVPRNLNVLQKKILKLVAKYPDIKWDEDQICSKLNLTDRRGHKRVNAALHDLIDNNYLKLK